MFATKITINKLNEEQMRKIRNYLNSMPNKSHKEGSAFYGSYVEVEADVKTHINKITAETETPWFENVIFTINPVMSGNESKRKTERNEVAKGLTSLLAEFLEEK